jgi:uncharacterized membrane protein
MPAADQVSDGELIVVHEHGTLEAGPEAQDPENRSPAAPVARLPRLCLIAFLVVVALVTGWGLVQLWPHGEPKVTSAGTDFAAPGVTFPRAQVVSQSAPCPVTPTDATLGGDDIAVPGSGSDGSGAAPLTAPGAAATPGPSGAAASCGQLTVQLESGSGAGHRVSVYVPPEVLRAGLQPGDRVELMKVPDYPGAAPSAGSSASSVSSAGAALAGSPDAAGYSPYSFVGIERGTPLWVLVAVFLALVALVARWRGVRSVLGLVVAGVVILQFVLPSLLVGNPAVPVAVVGSVAIMYLVLYLAHGVSLRTSTALAGTVFGVAATALVGELAVRATHLTGVGDENAGFLQAFIGNISLQGLLTCGIIIAGLGVLNDVTITQASAVWELRAAGATSGLRDLFARAMRIGRDHLASTVYTIVFAYVGTAVPVMLLIALYRQPIGDLLTSEDLTAEIVRTLASAIGLILAIPLTTAVAVAVIGPHSSTGRRPSSNPPAISPVEERPHAAVRARPVESLTAGMESRRMPPGALPSSPASRVGVRPARAWSAQIRTNTLPRVRPASRSAIACGALTRPS